MKYPIRIAHICHSLQIGGLERLIEGLIRRADSRRYQHQVFCLRDGGPIADALAQDGFDVECLNWKSGLRFGGPFQLARQLRRERIQIVHSHNTGSMFYAAVAGRLAACHGIVHTRHGQRHLASRKQTRAFALASRLVDRVVAVSDDSAQLTLEEGVPPSRVGVIHNGIDGGRYSACVQNVHGPAVFVGRMVPEKDLPTLVEALSIVIEKHPEFRVRLIGDGPDRAAAEQLSTRFGIQHALSFLGMRDDIPNQIDGCSMFLQSSLTEGVSLTLLEAMAAKIPTVATRVGGNIEVIDDEKTGLLVASGDPQQLAQAITRLWRDKQELKRMGLAAFDRVNESFSHQAMINSYHHLYESLAFANLPTSSESNPSALVKVRSC